MTGKASAQASHGLTPAEQTFIEIVAATCNEYRAVRNHPASLMESIRLLLLGTVSQVEAQVGQDASDEVALAGIIALNVMTKHFSEMCAEAAARLVAANQDRKGRGG